jgi:hypothetical protein
MDWWNVAWRIAAVGISCIGVGCLLHERTQVQESTVTAASYTAIGGTTHCQADTLRFL